MKSIELRKKFINFFKSKKHTFIPSSPIVVSDDPTLLFVNAGMNQFKDVFLGNSEPASLRVVNSQKCLRVSGKHNDLEEVGHDTYHHTMFEMLGNWSFGDYFKQEAICFAWEFLIKELQVSEDRLYVSFFQGDPEDNLSEDNETKMIWKSIINEDKLVSGAKKDNFWEMGKIGPCGPCTEIHIDLRSDLDREKTPTQLLINKDHPEVIEIWNIVFIEFNRKKDNSLEPLPKKHVDTGMGFERLCMAMQQKRSTYDTDIFLDLIKKVSNISSINYGDNEATDIAIRVVVDHIRAIVFSISDGQFPSNNGAGYVIRRILRRAVRYGYTYLNMKEPFLYQLVPLLADQFKLVFPEINNQYSLIQDVIKEEERTFFNTLGKGIDLINNLIHSLNGSAKVIDGSDVFELYDTYGFPPDLTALILKEQGLSYNQNQFNECMEKQKNRSRSASEIVLGDWVHVNDNPIDGFVGYESYILDDVIIIKYREVKIKDQKKIQLVFNKTPFYAEGGGQVGDSGFLYSDNSNSNNLEPLSILDTKKENNIIIHIVENMTWDLEKLSFLSRGLTLKVDVNKRKLTTRNHSATHLLHHILRNNLGSHVEQRGSYVNHDYFRFDFTHFEKINNDNLIKIEHDINSSIIKGIPLDEFRELSIKDAKSMGAISLFGEKYGDLVRVVKFGDSIELCGGTHVANTSEIGIVKIISESSVAAGVRRIEAVTSLGAINFLNNISNDMAEVKSILKTSDSVIPALRKIIIQNKELIDIVNNAEKNELHNLILDLEKDVQHIGDYKVLLKELNVSIPNMKNICFSFIEKYDNVLLALATKKGNKTIINIALSKSLVKNKGLNASDIVNKVARHINGKGGGQPFFAVASGNSVNSFLNIFAEIKLIIKDL